MGAWESAAHSDDSDGYSRKFPQHNAVKPTRRASNRRLDPTFSWYPSVVTTLLRFRVQGTIEEAETGRPLSGHIVRAFDKDVLFDDKLGLATTDEQGRFLIEFTEDAFRDFMELTPDLYLRIYDPTGERLLHQTPIYRDPLAYGNLRVLVPGTDLTPE